MTITEAVEILEHHNSWRKGLVLTPTDPKEVTIALDIVIKNIKLLL